MVDEVKKPATEDEFFTLAGVNPDVVRANEGVPNAEQLALLNATHGITVMSFYLASQAAKAASALSIKKRAEESQAETIKDLFKDFEVENPKKLFNQMKEWAKDTYSPEEYAELKADTERGGRAQKAALKEIAEAYTKANPLTKKVVGGVDGDAIPHTPPGYLSMNDFVTQRRALKNKGLKENSKEIKSLDAQRMASRAHESK